MKLSPRAKIAGLIAIPIFGVLYYFLSDYWFYIAIAGLVLCGVGLLRRSGTNEEGLVKTSEGGGALMELPDEWSETGIERVILASKPQPNLLLSILNNIGDRFILGQEIEVGKKRIQVLELFLQQAGLLREVYSWQQAIKNKLHEQEEADKLKRFQRKSRLAELEDEARQEELLTKIEEERKKRADLNKLPEPKSQTHSAEEMRLQKRQEAERAKGETEKELRITQANPTLTPEEKIRRVNRLQDRLDQIEEERLRWL